jgi:integrase
MATIIKRVVVTKSSDGRRRESARYDVRYREPEGRQRKKTFLKRVDADKFAMTVEADKLRGTYLDIDAGKESFAAYADRWVGHTSRDPQTLAIRERMLRLHVKPVIGNVELRKITGSTLRGLIASLNVADKYAADIFDLVSSILTAAVDDKLLARNPAKDPSVRRQKPRAPKRNVRPWPDEWIEKMHTAIHDRYKITVTLGAGLGLRQGEIFGLAVEDIDYVKDVVRVRRQVKMVGKKLTFAPPKARKDDDAPREIPLPPDVKEALASHLRSYPAKSVTLPWRDPELGKPVTVHLIVTTRNDAAIARPAFNARSWSTARRRADIPVGGEIETGMHGLRHWYASSLLAGGASPVEVSVYLGHSDVAFTMRTYGHLMESSAERARVAISAAFATAWKAAHKAGNSEAADNSGT